jgi:hypothetical protein
MSDPYEVVIWEKSGAVYWARARSVATGSLCYLEVEPLPFGQWDWQAWNQGGESVGRGAAESITKAMRAAEAAV